MTRTSTTGNRPSSRRGFTLLELMVVFFLLVLMTGTVAVSLVPALRDARLRGGTRMMVAALRAARDYAVAHATQARVRVSDDRRMLSIEVPDTSDDSGAWRTLGTPAGRPRTLPEGVTVADAQGADALSDTPTANGDASGYSVTFTALGQGQDTQVMLQDDQGRQRRVLVEGITGYCRVAEAQP